MHRRIRRFYVVAVASVAMLALLAVPASASGFPDVGGGVHAEAIDALSDQGVFAGDSDGRFNPGGTLTRAQFASVMARIAGLSPDQARPFSEVRGGPHADNVAAATDAGFIQGYPDGTFRPSEPITRDQMAALLARWLEPPSTTEVFFDDLDGTIHGDAINALAARGVIQGTGDGSTFSPREQVRRDQAASFVHRATGGSSGGDDDGGWCSVWRWSPITGGYLAWEPC